MRGREKEKDALKNYPPPFFLHPRFLKSTCTNRKKIKWDEIKRVIKLDSVCELIKKMN